MARRWNRRAAPPHPLEAVGVKCAKRISTRFRDPMEWTEGRITRGSVDAAKAPETRDVTTEPAYTGADKLELSSAREKILDLMYEIEALRREHSGSYVERLRSELSVSYATNRGFKQRWEEGGE